MSQERVVEDPGFARMDRRRFIKVASMAGGGLFLLACTPAAVSPGPKVSASVGFAASAGGVGLNVLPVMVADEMGYLAEEGISQEVTVFGGGGDIVRGMLQGSLPLGNPSNVTVAQAYEQGETLKLIAENAPFAMAFWVVRADSPLKSMKDIKGKKLGYTGPGAESQIFALTALKALGLKDGEDMQLVVVRGLPDQLTALKTGIIDIAWSADPLVAKGVLAKEIRILGTPNEFVTAWSQCMLATTNDYARANGDVLRAYLKAYVKAIDFMKSSTERAAEIWAKRTDTPPEIAKAAIKTYPMEKYTAKFDPAIFRSLTEVMVAQNLVKQPPPWDKIIDQSFLPPEMRVKLT